MTFTVNPGSKIKFENITFCGEESVELSMSGLTIFMDNEDLQTLREALYKYDFQGLMEGREMMEEVNE